MKRIEKVHIISLQMICMCVSVLEPTPDMDTL